jgi:NADPH:quinone reductase-like Zn-dependent oxidoreductase
VKVKAAVVWEAGKAPLYSEFEDPIPHEDEVCIHVTASALTNFTKLRASGKHFSFAAQPPFVVGIDGVGKLDDGTRVYFLFPQAPFGGMAERTVAHSSHCIHVPENMDDVTLAAIADPGMAAWSALETRAQLKVGETVLINGATGTAGRMAIQIARHLGAEKIIATGRNRSILSRLPSLGADVVIALDGDDKTVEDQLRVQISAGIDVVLDFLWGTSATQLLALAGVDKRMKPIRFVQVGTASAPAITLPGAILRSSSIQMMGSGIGSIPLEEIIRVLSKLMAAASVVGFQIETTKLPINRIEEAWSSGDTATRIVLEIKPPDQSP